MQTNIINRLKKLDYYAFLLLVFSISFYREISAFTYAIWVLFGLITLFINSKDKRIRIDKNLTNKRVFALLLLYYLLLTMSLLWSQDTIKGLHKLETKLALIITPLMFLNIPHYFYRKVDEVFNAFILGVLVASMLCLIIALVKSIELDIFRFYEILNKPLEIFNIVIEVGNHFFYSKFSHFLHPTYFSMMITLSVIVLRFKRLKTNKKGQTIYYLFGILFLLFILFLLSSKAGLFITYTILFLDIIIYIYKYRKFKILLKQLLFYLTLLYLALTYNYRKPVDNIVASVDIEDVSFGKVHNGSTSSRITSWKVATKVALRNPILGVGIGDSHAKVKEEYEKKEFASNIKHHLNAHNQFFEDALRIGIIGVVIFIFILIIPFISSIKQEKYLTAYFMILIGANALFESILEKQTGVMFFSVFYCFLVFIYRER